VKKLLTVLVALLATFAVAAPASATAPTYTWKDKAFIKFIRSEEPVFYAIPVKTLIKLAKSTCAVLNAGEDEMTVAWMMVDEAGMSTGEASTFMGAAIASYCPRHGDDLLRGK
jgi:hypothetical protein